MKNSGPPMHDMLFLPAWLQGDEYVVNCLEPHPFQPLCLATSGEKSAGVSVDGMVPLLFV
jgi:hypothetical protein